MQSEHSRRIELWQGIGIFILLLFAADLGSIVLPNESFLGWPLHVWATVMAWFILFLITLIDPISRRWHRGKSTR